MDKTYKKILERARDLFFNYRVINVSIEDICKDLGITEEAFHKYIKNKAELVDKILEVERVSFQNIFDEYDFEGQNAIDILLIVSKEVNQRFKYVNPAITYDLKNHYPEIYHKHFEDKLDFIFEKIKINIEKGTKQGMYREDLSIELIARTYMSKLIDIHDPNHYQPEEFSFAMMFNIMFEKFIEGISNEKGMEYYKKRKQLFTILNFGK